MHNNLLSGVVPSDLGRLSSLIYLDLMRTQLSGRVPTEFASLSLLTLLDLSTTAVTGPIPSQFVEIGVFNSLHSFAISQNMLTGPYQADLER